MGQIPALLETRESLAILRYGSGDGKVALRLLWWFDAIYHQKRVKDEKVYKPRFLLNSEGFSLEKVGDLVARAIRNTIRANRFARIIRNWNPYFYSTAGRFARITRISDSRESPDSRESRH